MKNVSPAGSLKTIMVVIQKIQLFRMEFELLDCLWIDQFFHPKYVLNGSKVGGVEGLCIFIYK